MDNLRMMPVPAPLPKDEVEQYWLRYFEEFTREMPQIVITTQAKQAMRDAFYHGALAVLIRNAPEAEGKVIH